MPLNPSVRAEEKVRLAASLRALLSGLVDYAGLFPPAGLAMPEAVANYERYRRGLWAWALGRFVVPLARLAEFEAVAAEHYGSPEWQISALVAKSQIELPAVASFNNANHRKARIDSLELKVTTTAQIDEIARMLPLELPAYVEIPTGNDPSELTAAI